MAAHKSTELKAPNQSLGVRYYGWGSLPRLCVALALYDFTRTPSAHPDSLCWRDMYSGVVGSRETEKPKANNRK